MIVALTATSNGAMVFIVDLNLAGGPIMVRVLRRSRFPAHFAAAEFLYSWRPVEPDRPKAATTPISCRMQRRGKRPV